MLQKTIIAILAVLCLNLEGSRAGPSQMKPRAGSRSFSYKSYQSTIYCNPSSAILYPKTASEVQQIVKSAIASGTTVKAFGSRHSITDVICTEGIPMGMEHINYMMANDDDTATVGAGAEMRDVLEFLHERNKSFIHVPAYGGITVAGAMGTGAHGSSLLHPPSLSDQAVRMTIIDGMGEIRVIDDPHEINAFRVHLGLLGVILDVTLKTVPLFKMTVQNNVESEAILLDGRALQWAQEYDWYEMWWFPSTRTVVVSKGNYTDDLSTPGNATSNMIPDQTPGELSSARDAFETMQGTRNKRGLYAVQDFTQYSLYQDVVGKPPIYSEDGKNVKNPATGYGWKLQSNKCVNKCAWDNGNSSVLPEESAMAFDMTELPGIIKTMKGILSQAQATFTMIGVFIRFSRPSDAFMAITSGRPSVHVEWATPMRRDPYGTARDGLGAYQAILQAMLKQHGGRPHWGKNGLYYLSQDVIKSTTSNREAFINVMKKYDPNGLFLNKFGKRILGLSNEMNVDPMVKRCALQDYCLCSKNSDCANLQQCVLINGYSSCQDIAAGFLPPTVRSYDSRNITSIYEAVERYSMQSENIEEQ